MSVVTDLELAVVKTYDDEGNLIDIMVIDSLLDDVELDCTCGNWDSLDDECKCFE